MLCVSVGGVLVWTAPASAGLPSGTTPVTVTAGVVTTGIDAHVRQLGAISGKITSVARGEAVGGAEVWAIGPHGGYTSQVGTTLAHDGRYLLRGLTPGRRYRVCVIGRWARGGGSVTGYLSRCYTSAAWSGDGSPPASAHPVTVTSGMRTTRVDVALPSAASIAGTVRSSAGTALAHVRIMAKNRSAGPWLYGSTDRTGHYRLTGLTATADG